MDHRGKSNKNFKHNSDTTWQLLQPELLSIDNLKKLLSERFIEIPKEVEANKDQLVELYRRVVFPLPQRQLPAKSPAKQVVTSKRTRVDDAGEQPIKKPAKTSTSNAVREEEHNVRNGNHHAEEGSQDLQNDDGLDPQTKVHHKITLKRRAWYPPTVSDNKCASMEETTANVSVIASIAKAPHEKTEDEALSPVIKKPRTTITWP